VHGHRHRRVDAHRAVAEGAVFVPAPAKRVPERGDRARVRFARGDPEDPGEPLYTRRGRALGRGPVADLAVRVVAPTLHGFVAHERAGPLAARADRGDAGERPGAVFHDDRDGARRGRAVAELTEAVVTPAADAAVDERTGVAGADGHGGGGREV